MSLTRRELKEYLGPSLSRKSFRFSRLRGLVHDGTLQNLRVAKEFSRPDNARLVRADARPDGPDIAKAYPRDGNGGERFVREVCRSDPQLKLPVMDVLRRLAGDAGPGGGIPADARAEAMDHIQRILLECGVHAAFGRPSSAGLMLHQDVAAGIPLHIYLGESSGNMLGRGRLNRHPGGSWSVEVDLTQTAARMMQAMDYWLSDSARPPGHLDARRLSFVRAPRERLIEGLMASMESGSVKGDFIPIMFALDVSCLRLICESLERIAHDSATPRQFLANALNLNVRWVLAHEIAHLQESRANGPVALHPVAKEAFAYLLQAVHSDPADAFRSMMLRGFDITLMMPSFDAALRALGPHAFCLERSYLRGWAKGMLDVFFRQFGYAGDGGPVIDASPILAVQSDDFIKECDMPFVERALCNPNRRVDESLLNVRTAEPA